MTLEQQTTVSYAQPPAAQKKRNLSEYLGIQGPCKPLQKFPAISIFPSQQHAT